MICKKSICEMGKNVQFWGIFYHHRLKSLNNRHIYEIFLAGLGYIYYICKDFIIKVLS